MIVRTRNVLLFALLLTLLLPLPAYAPHPLQVPVPVEQEHPDLDLLARIIHAEARGECITGQVAVGAVVLNRVNDPRFPDSVEAVIFESGQFQPVWQGTLPVEAGERSREAARRVLAGENPVGDSLYFYHPGISRCEWIRGRETVAVVGVHVFAR